MQLLHLQLFMVFFLNFLFSEYGWLYSAEYAANKYYSKYMVVPTSHAVARSGIMHAIAVINFFNTACHYLPQLLNRASYSPELIVFIQSGKFQNTYGKKIFPLHHARVTRDYNRAVIAQVVQACEAYVTVGELFSVH